MDTSQVFGMPRGVPVYEDPGVPLRRTVRDPDGAEREEEALCWVIDGRVHVHPDRMEAFKTAVASAGRKILDGGSGA